MMDQAPQAVLEHEQVAGGEAAAVQLLLAGDEGQAVIDRGILLVAEDLRRSRARQDGAPALQHQAAAVDHGPARMDAADGYLARPDPLHGGEVAGADRAIEFQVLAEGGVGVHHRSFPWKPRTVLADPTRRVSPSVGSTRGAAIGAEPLAVPLGPAQA